MLKAQGKETYMEKHLFTQLKYQVQSEEIRDKQIRRTHIKDDIN